MIVTITGPSCAGKSTLEALLREKGFLSLTSTTTRPMRVGEVNGKNYHFVSVGAFETMAAASGFVETVEFNGNKYGVSTAELNRKLAIGRPILAVVEPNGLTEMRDYAAAHGLDIYSVFIDNPVEVLAERFLERFREDIRMVKDYRRVVKTYSSRLAVMTNEERQWSLDAQRDGSVYEMVVDRFDANNAMEIVELIRDLSDIGVTK